MRQKEKGHAFRGMHERNHERNRAFILPNPWDIGSAKILAHLGFEALATTSGGYACSMGRPDYRMGREAVMAHVSALASATDLPLSADLENGFGDAPEDAAETIRLAAKAGAVGGSIEDARGQYATGRPENAIYDLPAAVERVRAAAESAHGLEFPFMLTARVENYLHGRRDLKDTITRLQAYQEAGADVLYAPGVTDKDEIATLVKSVDRPVNVLMGLAGVSLSVADLSAMGVRRISVGSGLARAAYSSFIQAAREMREQGTFTFADQAATTREIVALFDWQG